MAALFADANLALHRLPSDYYEGVEGLSPTTRDFGLETTSLPVHENVRGLSQKMRDGFVVTNKTPISDIIENLGFPNDSEHREHLNKTLSTIPDGEERFIQSVKNIAHEASGIEEDYDRPKTVHANVKREGRMPPIWRAGPMDAARRRRG